MSSDEMWEDVNKAATCAKKCSNFPKIGGIVNGDILRFSKQYCI